jgi:probable HAF family extracellular repeat protein
VPEGLNNAGEIVGECCVDYLQVCDCAAFGWRAGSMRELPAPPPGREGVAPQAINQAGTIAGYSWVCGETNRGVVSRGDGWIDLNDLLPEDKAHWLVTRAIDINDFGEITGWAQIDGVRHSFLYDGREFHDVGSLGGSVPFTQSLAVNRRGVVVGGSFDSEDEYRAFRYRDGIIGQIPVFPERATSSQANAINGNDKVAGLFVDSDGFTQVAFTHQNGVTRELEMGENVNSVATDVNRQGLVVGGCDGFTGQFYFDLACLWRGTSLLILDDLLVNEWEHTPGTLTDINDDSWIAGFSQASPGLLFHGFVARPALSGAAASPAVRRPPVAEAGPGGIRARHPAFGLSAPDRR